MSKDQQKPSLNLIYIGHIPGLAMFCKTKFPKIHNKIDEELQKTDTKRIETKRIVLKFEPYE